MRQKKKYNRVWFTVGAIEKIISEFQDIVSDPGATSFPTLMTEKGSEEWDYDTPEDFLSELRSGLDYASISASNPELSLSVTNWPVGFNYSSVSIESEKRERIVRLGNVVDSCADDCFISLPPEKEKAPAKPKIFIGHGGTPQWRDLKDHLQDQHGYDVISYETGSRTGHTIRDIIAEMLQISSFAVLVMTGEDQMEDGSIRARQNVIHEIGLFQGKLGFTKAIVLKEEGAEEFSNIHGVEQICYSKSNIKETFGEVLAVLRREFGKRR